MRTLGLRRTVLDIGLTFGRQFLAGLIQLGLVVLISRVLGPEGAGVYALALLLPTVMSRLLNLGLATSNVYFIASKQFEVSSAWAVSRDLGLVMGALGFVGGGVFVTIYGAETFPGVPKSLLYLSLGIFPVSLLSGMVSSVFQGLQDFRAFNILVLLQPPIALAGLSVLWSMDTFNMSTILVMVVASHAISLAVGIALLARRIPVCARRISEERYLGPAIRYGYKAHLSNLIAFLNYRSDLFFVNFFLGPAAAGVYMIAVSLVEQLWLISQAVSTVILPRLSSMNNDEDGRRALTPLIARLVFLITLVAALGLAFFVSMLIEVLFGEAFSGAVNVVLFLLPGVVFLACGRVLANDLAARGLVHINLYLAIGILVINIAGNLLLIPVYGIVGAAMATSVAYSINFLIRLIIQQHITSVPWWHNIMLRAEDFSRLRSLRGNHID